MHGLAAGTSHPAHLHVGTCAKQGKVAIPLPPVVADAAGGFEQDIAVSDIDQTTHQEVTAIPAGKWYLNIHTGPGLDTAEQFRPILCGDIASGGGSASADMKAPPGIGAGPPGTVTLTLDRGSRRLTILTKLAGMEPNSRHPGGIHKGLCARHGDSLYGLGIVTAGADGSIEATKTIDGVASIEYGGWYVEVLQGPGSDDQQGGTPIACGDVLRS